LSAGAALWLVGPKKQHAGLCLDGAGLHWKGRF
jgi:hypothetical protein